MLSGDLGVSTYFRRPDGRADRDGAAGTRGARASRPRRRAASAFSEARHVHDPRYGGRLKPPTTSGSTAMMSIPESLGAPPKSSRRPPRWRCCRSSGGSGLKVATPEAIKGFLLLDSLLTGRLDAFASALAQPRPAGAGGARDRAPRRWSCACCAPRCSETVHDDYVAVARACAALKRAAQSSCATRSPTRRCRRQLIGVQAGFHVRGHGARRGDLSAIPGSANLIVDAVRNNDLPVIPGGWPGLLRARARPQRPRRGASTSSSNPKLRAA